jgi:hypothetical protein
MKNIPTNKPDRETFYTGGTTGYTDYPFADQGDAKAKA